jgi:serine protease Do
MTTHGITRKERSMRAGLSVHLWAAVGLMAALALVTVRPGPAFTAGPPTPLWSERTLDAASPPPSPWVELARMLKPAVVNINTKRFEGGGQPGDPFFERFFETPRRAVRSLGSGFVVNANGYIVTNNHVVDGASEIKVRLSDGRELTAKVLGRDGRTDLALLKVDATGLPLIPLGDSSLLRVGEPVMAIGNPFGLEQTVTTGIVSGTGRVIGDGPYDDFIQTDASINPGNSGGPLINVRGQAVGINTAIVTQSGGSVGIGFAIPVNLAKPVLAQLAGMGHVVRGYLGVAIQRVTPELARSFGMAEARGALVSAVVEGSPATKAGLKPGDVIVEYDGRPIARSEELPRAVAATPVGRQVRLIAMRDGKAVTLSAKIAQLAEAEEPATPGPKGRPALGLAVETLTPKLAQELGLPDRSGVLVRGIEEDSPAASAGVRAGDVIAEVDHHPVKTVDDLTRLIHQHQADVPTLLLVHRQGGHLYIALPS